MFDDVRTRRKRDGKEPPVLWNVAGTGPHSEMLLDP